jgi:hypothetical protein
MPAPLFELQPPSITAFPTILNVLAMDSVFRFVIPFFNYLEEMPDLFPHLFLDFLRLVIDYSTQMTIDFELIGFLLKK